NYDTAQGYYENSLKIYSRKKDHTGKGYSQTGLGIIHEYHDDPDQARRYYDQALESFKKTGDTDRQAIVRSLLASTYKSQAEEDSLPGYKGSFQKSDHEGSFQRLDHEGSFQKSGNEGSFQRLGKSGHKGQGKSAKISQDIGKTRSKFPISRRELVIALIYLLGLIAAEALVAYSDLQVGLALEAVILFALLINSSLKTSHNFSLLLQSMMALPIIRIIGLSIPLIQIEPLYWFPIISIPLFAASFTIMRAQGLSFKNVGFIWDNIPVQLAIALTGVILGTIEFMILEPKPLIATFNLQNLLFASIILIVSTGLAEEILFRGIIQKNAENVFGALVGLLYTSLLFTALHIGWASFYDLIFVFMVAIFYGYVFLKTRSIVGITLSHGISNTFLFLIVPFYAPLLYSWLPF
ncbi:MAG TPA: CPBP family glutamic-type intramembrane protease, partial [Methanobacterium sp.]